MGKKILVVGLNAVIQKTIVLPDFIEDGVVRAEKYIEDAAGKATNVCRVLTQLNVPSACLTPLGEENGIEFLKLAKRDELEIIPVPHNIRVRNCYTLVNIKNDKSTEVIVDEPEPISAETERRTMEIFGENIDNYDYLIITGSKAKGYSDEIVPEMVRIAKEKGKIVFADYREKDLHNSFKSREIKPDYVKINAHEFINTFCPELDYDCDISELRKEITKIVDEFKTTFIITGGSKETVYAGPDGEWGSYLPPRIKPLNAVGCGDTFLAGLVCSVLEEKSLADAVVYASELAARNAVNLRPGSIK